MRLSTKSRNAETPKCRSTFKLVLAYDGTDYVGWQRQATGVSIQGLLEDALREFDDRPVAVAGAGRTDAGVHALGQVASCTLDRAIDPATLVRALNHKLPDDVRVRSARLMPGEFHARFDARAKTYRYRIWNAGVFSPFQRRYAWHLPGRLNVDAMRAAARFLEGTHDFAAFQGQGSDASTTTRTITKLRIVDCGLRIAKTHGDGLPIAKTHGDGLRIAKTHGDGLPNAKTHRDGARIDIEVTGNGFLRHMVRTLVGTLVEIGRGRQDPQWMARVVAARDRTQAGQTAPAHGLFLVAVGYGADLAAEP